MLEKELVTDPTVLEQELIMDADAAVLTPEQKTAPLVQPDRDLETEKLTPQPPQNQQKRRPIALILTALGIGAIASGSFGYRWWQYASTHEQTDNAYVQGHRLQPLQYTSSARSHPPSAVGYGKS